MRNLFKKFSFQANLKRHLENVAYEEFQTSSEESSEEQEPMDDSNEILERVFGSYDLKNQNCRTKEALLQTISSGSCLICISEVKKKDAIWSCQACHCSFHLNCIQRWAQDSIFQVRFLHFYIINSILKNIGSSCSGRTTNSGDRGK